jgi:hypothetical protein
MPASDKNLEKILAGFLEVKNKYGLDNEKFLVLLGMVNLMSIINLLEKRAAGSGQGGGVRRPPAPQELVPFMGMFGGSKARQSGENQVK